jgi:hypothetical protein
MTQLESPVQKISLLALQKPLEEYVTWLERLTPRSIRLIEKIAAHGMAFSDPFNLVRGVDAVEAAFEKRLAAFGGSPKLTVTDRAFGRDNEAVYLRWTMTGTWRGKPIAMNGIAELAFTLDGKIYSHIDHWDAGSVLLGGDRIGRWSWQRLKSHFA